MTDFAIKPDDFEPLDQGERRDAVFGSHHIGREDETREEIALFFDIHWLPDASFFEWQLRSLIHHNGGRVMGFSSYQSTVYSNAQLQDFLSAIVCSARQFNVGSNDPLSVVVVELTKPTIDPVHTALKAYTAYVGHGNISCPSDFRSIVTAELTYE